MNKIKKHNKNYSKDGNYDITYSKFCKSKGITLVALIITIIIMLILAGITLNLTLGNNGLFSRAKNVTEKWSEAEIKEKEDLKKLVNEIRVEYMDKIPPIVDIGEMSKSIAWVDEPISLLVTISDNESGVDIEKCMWEYNTEPNLIGEDESLYTGGIFTKEIEEIELKAPGKGIYYLHVLAIDKAGNKIEKVSEKYAEINDILYLYKDGNEYIDTTGGYTYGKDSIVENHENVLNYCSVSLSKNSNNMYLSHLQKTSTTEGGGWTTSMISTKKVIDLTYFNEFYIDFTFSGSTDGGFQLNIFDKFMKAANRVKYSSLPNKVGVRTTENMNITNLKGNYLVGLSGWIYTTKWISNHTSAINIYALYLKC